jgi:outer membrane protein
MTVRWLLPCWGVMAAALCGSCLADDGLKASPDDYKDFGGQVGLGLMHAPHFLGARDSSVRVLPMVQLRWGKHWFAGVDGAGYRWGDREGSNAGLRVTLDQGRSEGTSAYLKGLGDIPTRAELGGFASVRLLPFLIGNAALKVGSGADHDGMIADWSLRSMLPLNDRVRMAVAIGGTWANQASMQSLFGVTEVQSLSSGYAAYQPAAGWRDVSTQLMAMADLGDRWQLIARLEYKILLGDAERSPLVQEQDATSSTLLLVRRF